MPVWMQFLREHQEILWVSFVMGLLGTFLYTVLFHQAVSIGRNLLNQETIRNARDNHRALDFSCMLYEQMLEKMWLRATGLALSLLLVSLSLTGLVLL